MSARFDLRRLAASERPESRLILKFVRSPAFVGVPRPRLNIDGQHVDAVPVLSRSAAIATGAVPAHGTITRSPASTYAWVQPSAGASGFTVPSPSPRVGSDRHTERMVLVTGVAPREGCGVLLHQHSRVAAARGVHARRRSVGLAVLGEQHRFVNRVAVPVPLAAGVYSWSRGRGFRHRWPTLSQ